MTEKELITLTDKCVFALNDGGQPITLRMASDTLHKKFGVNLSEQDLDRLYKRLTGETGLCEVHSTTMGGIGVNLILTEFGRVVARDHQGSYSKYLKHVRKEALWKWTKRVGAVAGLMWIVYQCVFHYKDYAREKSQSNTSEVPKEDTISNSALEVGQEVVKATLQNDTSSYKFVSSDTIKSKQPSLPVQD